MPAPRALSSFIALSGSRLLSNEREDGLTWLRTVCGVLCILAIFPTPFRVVFIGLAVIAFGMVAIERLRRHDAPVDAPQAVLHDRRKLLDTLNRHRGQVGLQQVIGSETLQALEASAFQWEQIESILTTRPWISHSLFREEIQYSADEYMSQIVEAHLLRAPYQEAQLPTRRLNHLLKSLEDLDRAVFTYPRPDNVPDHFHADFPMLSTPELTAVKEALVGSTVAAG